MRNRVPARSLAAALAGLAALSVIGARAAPGDGAPAGTAQAGTTHAGTAQAGTARGEAGEAGCHAFDFVHGKWKMPNDRLVRRLAGSHQWEHFYTYDVGSPLPGCVGDMDIMKTDHWPHFVGVTIRTYDPKTGLWRIYWTDNRFSQGKLLPPVVGRFKGNVGVFYGKDVYNGIPVVVRFIWTVNPKGSKVVATWKQAFSADGGKTWEENWRNSLIPDTR